MADKEIIGFESARDFEKWLARNHSGSNGIWVRFFKKASGKATFTYDEALDLALCYGWIDGQVNKYDEESYIQKFTPRRPRSSWSKRNTQHAERLIKAGKMRAAGLKAIEEAKADGRWDRAYDSPSTAKVPEDFLKLLAKNPKAKAFYEGLDRTNKYSIAYRLQTAKDAQAREKKMKQILEMMAKGKKFH